MKKTTISLIIVSALLLALLAASFAWVGNLRRENARIKSNYEAAVTGDAARQQTVDVQELKQYFADEVRTLKEQGIRARNIENIIKVSYIYHDTLIYRDTLVYVYDTIRKAQRADFCVETKCVGISGQIVGDTLEIADINVQDGVMVALYREKRKCLFQKQKVRAIAVSECTGDTLSILRNLKVQR